MIYPETLHQQFERMSNLKVNHYCITDRPDEVGNWAVPITPFVTSSGWWNKINLYSKDMPSGVILYLDLDIVILQNFDEEINFMVESSESMKCVSDAIGWHESSFSSSLMCFESGIHDPIFQKFKANESNIKGLDGGDQVWTAPHLGDIKFLDQTFPNLKKNLKFDIASRSGNKFDIPLSIDENIKLVDCGGRPKPHELGKLPYIKANWHDVNGLL